MRKLIIQTAIAAACIVGMNFGAVAAPISINEFKLAPRIADKIKSGQPLNIIVSYPDVSQEFEPFVLKGVDAAQKADGVTAKVIGPVGPDADTQINQIETLMDTIDGLAIASVSTDALAPVINRMIEQGIPVVAYNTDNPASKRLVFAGQDLKQSGREAGKLMGDVLGGKGKVIITTINAAAQWSLDREAGAREGLAAYPGITVVSTLNTGTDPQQIYASIENALLANPDVNGVLSLECCSTPAAGTWVQRNNAKGKVHVVGFDLLDLTVQHIKDGYVDATIDQNPEKQGFEAVDLLVQFLRGKTIDDVDTGVKIYNSANIAELK